MQIVVAVELLWGRTKPISNAIRQISDEFLSLTESRRVDCHRQVGLLNDLEVSHR